MNFNPFCKFRYHLPALVLVFAMAWPICFYGLGANSFGQGDQTTHAKVVQEMVQDGHYWQLTKMGRPYLNKPPLKMWLSSIVVSAFGESNFTYRILDGMFGFGTVLVVYFFAVRLFKSRAAGVLSAAVLLGSRAFVFGHGIREAVQDPAMNFCAAAATVAAWRLMEAVKEEAPLGKRINFALIGGLLVACGVLTKSVAALMPFVIAAAFALLSGQVPFLLRHARREILAAAGCALVPPAVYLYLRYLTDPKVIHGMVLHEVYKRATVGYANQNRPLYYLSLLFEDRLAAPPELLVLGTLFAFYGLYRRRELHWLFLVCWAWVPVLVYSAAKSKLQWYIAAAFPGMSLVVGALIAAALQACRNAWVEGRASGHSVRGAAPGLLALYGIAAVGWNQFDINSVIFEKRPKSFLNQIVDSLENTPDKPRVVSYHIKLSRDEYLYLGMLRGTSFYTRDGKSLDQVLKEHDPALLLIPPGLIAEAARHRKIHSYAFSPMRFERQKWLAAVQLRPLDLPESFKPVHSSRNFAKLGEGDETLRLLSGFGPPGKIFEAHFRPSSGPLSRLQINSDTAWQDLGAKFVLRAASVIPGETLAVEVFLNHEKIAVFERLKEGFHPLSFSVKPKQLLPGANIMTFRYRRSDGQPIQEGAQSMLFESISASLAQPH